MKIEEIHRHRDQKDELMRGKPVDTNEATAEAQRRYSFDQFGGPQGIDPNSHGVELQ